MNIGIDIDDTLTNTNEASEEYVLKYEREHPNIKLDHYKLIGGNIDTPEAKKFFKENIKKICDNVSIKENAKSIIDKLKLDLNKEPDPMKQANILKEIMKIRGVNTSD